MIIFWHYMTTWGQKQKEIGGNALIINLRFLCVFFQ